MATNNPDIIIVGAGLSGISLSLSLSQAGFQVFLFEKETLPYHKVCGEYVSNECLGFLKSLGFDPFDKGAARIDHLLVSSQKGSTVRADLDMGGFGLSRYEFDRSLLELAKSNGVEVFEGTKIESISQDEKEIRIIDNRGGEYRSQLAVGSFGKRSVLDKGLKRGFIERKSPYTGVKYHLKLPVEDGLIALHNFQGGYAGISQIENEKVCICYLVSREIIRKAGGIKEAESSILSKNPYLHKIFTEAEFIWDKPKVISEISFGDKEKSLGRIFFSGDSAGMVAPLFGNGMAMALRSASLLSPLIKIFLQNEIELQELSKKYQQVWTQNFQNRMNLGRLLQSGFGKNWITEQLLFTNRLFPPLKRTLVRASHGPSF